MRYDRTRQSYLIEFSTVSDHFFVRISSVDSLWFGVSCACYVMSNAVLYNVMMWYGVYSALLCCVMFCDTLLAWCRVL